MEGLNKAIEQKEVTRDHNMDITDHIFKGVEVAINPAHIAALEKVLKRYWLMSQANPLFILALAVVMEEQINKL